MGMKPKVSANGTYVFDPEEIEQLDELSLTSVLSAVVESLPEADKTDSQVAPASTAPQSDGDTTINRLLSGEISADDSPRAKSISGPADADDLLDPELIFPELEKERE